MAGVSILCGLTYLILGVLFYNNKMLNMLSGVDMARVRNPNKLAKHIGITFIFIAVIFFLEILIFRNIAASEKAIAFTLIVTAVIGPIIAALTPKRYK